MSKSQKKFSKNRFDDYEDGGHQIKKIKKIYESKKSNSLKNLLKTKDITKIISYEDQL